MTKGKHGKRAENRQRAQDDALAPYRRKVATLTHDLQTARAKHAEEVEALRAELRRIRAERDQGLSPALGVAQREAARQRDRADAATQKLADHQRIHERILLRAMDHMREAHHMPTEAAMTVLLQWTGEPGRVMPKGLILAAQQHGLDQEALDRIARARGQL